MDHWAKFHILFALMRKSAAEVALNLQNQVFAMTISSDDESDGKWLPKLFLRAEDKQLIETGDWLTDEHIAAAQMLLKKDIPKVDGVL